MTDTRTPEQRQRIMRAVRQCNTEPEMVLRRALHAHGLRGWRCNWRAPGKPDLAWPVLELAVFVDGAFWHGHPSRHRPGRSGAYWDNKIAANVARDRKVDAELGELGWVVLRVWDFQVRREIDSVVDLIARTIIERTDDQTRSAWQLRLAMQDGVSAAPSASHNGS